MALFQTIQEWHYQGTSKREIARRLRIDIFGDNPQDRGRRYSSSPHITWVQSLTRRGAFDDLRISRGSFVQAAGPVQCDTWAMRFVIRGAYFTREYRH